MQIPSSSLDIEAAVPVQQTKVALLGENSSEAQIAGRVLALSSVQRILYLLVHLELYSQEKTGPVKTPRRPAPGAEIASGPCPIPLHAMILRAGRIGWKITEFRGVG